MRDAIPLQERVDDDLGALARIVDDGQPGWTRTTLSDADVAGRHWAAGHSRPRCPTAASTPRVSATRSSSSGKARSAIADLLAADPAGVVLGRSATPLAYDFSRTLARTWSPGDEIVVTRLDHDSNIRPWMQAAARAAATVRWAEFDPDTAELLPEHVAAGLSERTRLVAVTAASNLVGTRPDVRAIAGLAHGVGALLNVDGVHHTAHGPVDVAALAADLCSCSPYKFLGPHLGVLAARPELLETLVPDKLLPAPDAVPERFEYGTLPYELLAGTRAAVDVLADLGSPPAGSRRARIVASMTAVEEHEDALRVRIEKELAGFEQITLHSRAVNRTPTLLLSVEGRRAVEARRHLGVRGIAAPSGTFYALEASRRLGLGDEGGLRIGLAPYTSAADVDRLLDGLADFLRRPGQVAAARTHTGVTSYRIGSCRRPPRS